MFVFIVIIKFQNLQLFTFLPDLNDTLYERFVCKNVTYIELYMASVGCVVCVLLFRVCPYRALYCLC